MIILLDQDGVLADFEHAFIDAWRARHPDIPPVAFEDRKSFYIRQDYAPELRGMAEAIYTAPGFIRDLPPVPGALEAVKELLALGMDVRICSSPLSQFENCVAEKYLWVERHLGREATNRLILTKDKTLVHGHLLIDDKPLIEGAMKPRWKHILFDAPYNREVGWPDISLFGHDWAPLALSTWLIPLALFAAGLAACRWALALWRDDDQAAPALEAAK